jgi:hypothetical protein
MMDKVMRRKNGWIREKVVGDVIDLLLKEIGQIDQ